MYSKKYRLEKVEEFNGHNPMYDNMEGCICYPAYLKAGKRGWLLYEVQLEDEWMAYPHRCHTSVIQNVDYIIGDELSIVITTQNTRLTLKEVE